MKDISREPWRPAALLLLSFSSGCVLTSDLGQLGVFPGEDASASLDAEPPEDAPEPPVVTDAGAPAVVGDAGDEELDTGIDGACAPEPLDASFPDPNEGCFDLTAHSGRAALMPYDVRAEGEGFVTFTFRNPGGTGRYLREVLPIIDNAAVLHDMRLYQHRGELPEGVAQGRVHALNFLYAWAPGVPGTSLNGTGVLGLLVEPNGFFTLEVHYKLQPLPAGLDRSGLRVCTTASEPTYTASYSRLGSELANGKSAQGTCTPALSAPLTLVAIHPDLGARGRRSKLMIRRKSGELESVSDMPFSYDEEQQNHFILPFVTLERGESIVTTCEFAEATQSAAGAQDASCRLDVLTSPPGQLLSGGAWDTCLQ